MGQTAGRLCPLRIPLEWENEIRRRKEVDGECFFRLVLLKDDTESWRDIRIEFYKPERIVVNGEDRLRRMNIELLEACKEAKAVIEMYALDIQAAGYAKVGFCQGDIYKKAPEKLACIIAKVEGQKNETETEIQPPGV